MKFRFLLATTFLLSAFLISVSHALTDGDGDGLSDDFEDANMNGTVDAGETDPADSDSDDDGYDDGMEVTHGSDPLVAASVPHHQDPTRVNAFIDRPDDEKYFTGAPLKYLSLPLKINDPVHFALDFETRNNGRPDPLFVVQGSLIERIPDSSILQNGTDSGAPASVVGMSPIVMHNDGTEGIYVVSDDGELERWQTGYTQAELVWDADLTRSTCNSDSISAAPVVQLRRLSSAAFQAKYTTDLVYGATRFSSGCAGGDEDNNIVAFRADTGAVAWTFNGGASVDMDVVYNSPAQEQGSDVLFVGSDRNDSTQDSLWAIDTVTLELLWSVNVGPVWTTPLLHDGRVYICNTAGAVIAIDQATGNTIWSASNGGDPITSNPVLVENNAGEVYIASVDYNGTVWVVRDDQFFGSSVWSVELPGTTVGCPITAGLGGENLFLGGGDGRVYQMDLATGAIKASRLTTAGEAITTMAIQGRHHTGRVPSIFAGTDGGGLFRFSQPFRTNTYPLDTDGDGVTDGVDNSPTVANPGQADFDQDGIGDATDPPDIEAAKAIFNFWAPILWEGAPFDATLDGSPTTVAEDFFMQDSQHLPMTSTPVSVNMVVYSETVIYRSQWATDVAYHLNYSFDLVNWKIAQDGVDGVVITVHHQDYRKDKITIRVPADVSPRFFSYLTLSIGTP
jgi:outer membrane protein assembly factor BamB